MNPARRDAILNPDDVIARRDAAIDRLQSSRNDVQAALDGLGGLAAFRGTEWSVADVLHHLQPGGHVADLRAALEEEGPQLAKLLKNKDEQLADLVNGVLASIDEALQVIGGLTTEQLLVTQQRGNRHKPVIEMVEGIAHHFDVHIQQIRDIRARIGR